MAPERALVLRRRAQEGAQGRRYYRQPLLDAVSTPSRPVSTIDIAPRARGDLDATSVGEALAPASAVPRRDGGTPIALDEIGGLTIESSTLSRIQSLRGRRGSHISFDFHVQASGAPASAQVPAAWHDIDDLPATLAVQSAQDPPGSRGGPSNMAESARFRAESANLRPSGAVAAVHGLLGAVQSIP